MAAILCLAGGLAFPSWAQSQDDTGPSARPLSASELAQYRGGYTLPSGLAINVGITQQVSIDGEGLSATAPQLSADGTALAATATMVKLAGQQQVQTFIQTATNGAANIQNTLNNIDIQQLTTANIDVANFSKIAAPAAALNGLGSQVRSLSSLGFR